MTYSEIFNGDPHIFDHARVAGNIADIGRRQPTTGKTAIIVKP